MSQWLVFVSTIGIAALIYYGANYLRELGAQEREQHEVTRQGWNELREAKEAEEDGRGNDPAQFRDGGSSSTLNTR